MPQEKKTRFTRPTTTSPAEFAQNIVSAYLANDELYSEVLDKISADDFQMLEDAVIAGWRKDRPNDPCEREIATQEVCFMLGLEIGKRIGGVR